MPPVRRKKYSLEQLAQILEMLSERIGEAVSRRVEFALRGSEMAKKLGLPPPPVEPAPAPPRKTAEKRSDAKKCSIEGCQEPARARGLCSRHYQKQRYEEKRQSQPKRGDANCCVEGCTEKAYANDRCSRHFMEWVRSQRKENQSEPVGNA